MTDDEIAEALSAQGLDIRIDPNPANPEHKWLCLALEVGRQLCRRSNMSLSFALNGSDTIQAYALYRPKLVVVSVHCVHFLCQLTDRIVAKGIYQNVGTPAAPDWMPTDEHSAKTIRALIRNEPFVAASAVWRGDPERESLFTYLFITLFRLVVLHEIGHFRHRHGQRFTSQADSMDVDSAQPKLLPEGAALDSQARELVADKFACEMMSALLEEEIAGLRKVRGMEAFARLYLDTEVKRTGFIVQVAYLYFVAIDRLPDADPALAVQMSHPPASFRLSTIVSTAHTGVDDPAKVHAINTMAIAADAIMAVALDRKPSVKWLAQLDHPTFRQHYEKLYERVDAWAITPQKAPVSATNPG